MNARSSSGASRAASRGATQASCALRPQVSGGESGISPPLGEAVQSDQICPSNSSLSWPNHPLFLWSHQGAQGVFRFKVYQSLASLRQSAWKSQASKMFHDTQRVLAHQGFSCPCGFFLICATAQPLVLGKSLLFTKILLAQVHDALGASLPPCPHEDTHITGARQ